MRDRSSRRGHVAARILAAAVLALLGLPLAGPAPAHAHASLVSTDPEQGAVLGAFPGRVEFVFSEPMDPTAYVVVTAPDGSALAVGAPEVDGATITQEVADGGDGTYVMAVKAVSKDGHPLTGRVDFAVGEPSATPPTEEPAPEPAASADPSPTPAGGGDTTTRADAGGWRGHDAWVWLVGPAFLCGAGALWLAGRRIPGS